MHHPHDPHRRRSLRWLAAGAVGASGLATPLVRAADLPFRQFKIVNPTSPGGTVDQVSRIMADKMAGYLGVPVVVEHKPGGSGAIAATAVIRGPKDGSQVFFGTSSTMGFMKMLNKDLSYDPIRDLAPVVMVGSVPVGLFTANAHPTLEAFVAAARARPGAFSFSSTGLQSLAHLAGELLAQRAGLKMVHVPYTGSAAKYWTDLIGGELQMAIAGVTGGLPLARDGKLKLVAVASRERSKLFPEVPAAGELYPGYDVPAWFGFAAAAGTPPATIRLLEAAALAALREPATRGQFANIGVDIDPILGTEAFVSRIGTDNAMWEKLFRTAGLLAL